MGKHLLQRCSASVESPVERGGGNRGCGAADRASARKHKKEFDLIYALCTSAGDEMRPVLWHERGQSSPLHPHPLLFILLLLH